MFGPRLGETKSSNEQSCPKYQTRAETFYFNKYASLLVTAEKSFKTAHDPGKVRQDILHNDTWSIGFKCDTQDE